MSQVSIPALANLGEIDHLKFKEKAKKAFDYLSQTQEVAEKGDASALSKAIISIANNEGSSILFEIQTPPGTKVKSVSVPAPPENLCVNVEIEGDNSKSGDDKYYHVDLAVSNPGSGDWEIEFNVFTYIQDGDTSTYEGKWVFVKSSTKPDDDTAV